jgi:N-acyl-D-amino-acid deacylase
LNDFFTELSTAIFLFLVLCVPFWRKISCHVRRHLLKSLLCDIQELCTEDLTIFLGGMTMKKKWFAGFLVSSLFLAFYASQVVLGNGPEYSNKDAKGGFFIVVYDSGQMKGQGAAFREALENLFSADEAGLELAVMDGVESKSLAEQILSLPAEKRENLGGIIEMHFEGADENVTQATIEVYHYPFPPIAREHVQSPEYSLKFGSDSALLAICLREALGEASSSGTLSFSGVEIQPATVANPFLPRPFLRKTVRVVLQGGKALSQTDIHKLGRSIHDAASTFYSDEGSYVMGMISEKTRRHARPEDVEIRVFTYLYPVKEYTEAEKKDRREAMSKPVQMVRPFASGLYYIGDLDCLAPYSLKFINTSKNEKDFWYEVDEGSVVTSSLRGIVRTVPGKFGRYTSLENRYEKPPDEVPQVDKMDYVIEGATVFDGSRDNARFVGDVGIAGERIVAVGDLKNLPRDVAIKGNGLFLVPGFIDIHSHADNNILNVPYAPSHIRQGITTVLGGNCSFSPLGIGAFLAEVDKRGAAVNIGELEGNRPVRERVLGRRKGMFSYDELYREKELVDLAMEEGAFGMSTGLIYSVSEEAFAWELAEMAKQLKPYGGFYASHVRGETDEVLDAIREAIYIGEIAEVPVQISHMKVINKRNWGDMKEYLEIMKAARARGMDITGDQYPWRASGPAAHYTLYRLLVREAIKGEAPEVVLLKDMPGKYEKYSGRPLTELLREENMTPEQLLSDLQLTEDSKIYATYLCLADEDVRAPMREDFVMVCTDASLVSLADIESGKLKDDHPRKYRTYPEFLAKYVRDRGVCSWELGVYKCTGLPASKMKLKDRGVIKPGAYADLVLFDPGELDPGTDYRNQSVPPRGLKWVFINGQPALKEGEMTKIRAGKALRAYGNCKP